MTAFESLLPDLEKIIKKLEEVLNNPKNDVVRDSAIKRFEICFDLTWKTLKAYLEEKHNVQCFSPKTCFREAYNKEVLKDYDSFWLDLADLRNETAHTYKEPVAEKVYALLPKALEHFKLLLDKLKQN